MLWLKTAGNGCTFAYVGFYSFIFCWFKKEIRDTFDAGSSRLWLSILKLIIKGWWSLLKDTCGWFNNYIAKLINESFCRFTADKHRRFEINKQACHRLESKSDISQSLIGIKRMRNRNRFLVRRYFKFLAHISQLHFKDKPIVRYSCT